MRVVHQKKCAVFFTKLGELSDIRKVTEVVGRGDIKCGEMLSSQKCFAFLEVGLAGEQAVLFRKQPLGLDIQ